jgi:predicted RNA binding protein YcfA (HicA-like mRNA interferase family)
LLKGQGKGSHLKYEKDGKRYTVPFHKGKEIPNEFARKILKDRGIDEKG